ncbi:DUF4145 domain-containing protein [Rhizobium leucaenae]|uniref:Tetratricopeptide (TPR) repeat protein n=1 Tax=Rhizobium leucaenae TaxID=29450 RepID=A0A7W7A0Z3_9HYPH|nr:DUF4145 domain-containing protein [Rhizobium leucaenae]MBB4571735.1 tetratricopeptide (TPR) repeat protein [Rhizobium leucaenae]
MSFIITNCIRCPGTHVQHILIGEQMMDEFGYEWELAFACQACSKLSIYHYRLRRNGQTPSSYRNLHEIGEVESRIIVGINEVKIDPSVPQRIADLFREANACRQMQRYEAAGAMYRKALDVATKYIYQHDGRLTGKKPADALRVRIKSLGEMKILEQDIVELADVAALDGNDAAHDIDPYTAEEAEALEDLSNDLLDRFFVRPARVAAVKAKQIAAGVRSP